MFVQHGTAFRRLWHDVPPTPRSYPQALAQAAARSPRRLAYSFAGEALSYGDLLRRARRRAAGLRALGLSRGDRVALALPPGLELVACLAATTFVGAVPLVLNPGLPIATVAARAGRMRLAALVATASAAGSLRDLGSDPTVVVAEELAEHGELDEAIPAPDDEEPALLQLTSGSTGEPRAVVLSHRALLAWRRISATACEPHGDDVLVGWVPPWHVMGLVRFLYFPPFWGCPSHLLAPEVGSLDDWLETVAAVRATITSGTDFALRHATHLAPAGAFDLRSLRFVVSGGEPVRLSTVRAFEERFDLPGVVRPAYGLAEATMGVTSVRPGEPLRSDGDGAVSCGRALPEVDLRILDERGLEQARGRPGEIVLRSPTLFSGYFDAPVETERTLRDGWLHTGDWGRLDDLGELFVVGRRRLLVKHAGAALAPREVEEIVEALPSVVRSAVLGLARDERGEQLVVAAEVSALDPEELPRFAGELARRVRAALGVPPGEVLLLRAGSIPVTETGKVRHLVLRERLLRGELRAPELLFGRSQGWSA